MKSSMYEACVKPGIRVLTDLAALLEKAAQHAEAKNIDPAVLVAARLAPDKFPLSRQLQIASDTARIGASCRAGVPPRAFADNENSLPELGERPMAGLPHLQHQVLPNIHFHCTTAHDILRHDSVELGKMDDLGRDSHA
jgi:uncharacterized protein